MKPRDLIKFIRSELDEVEEELTLLESCECHHEKAKHARRLGYEIGDVLFDTFLLVKCCSRDFDKGVDDEKRSSDFSLDSIAHRAALKIERRCPYAFEGCHKPPTLELERKAWNEAKEREKAREGEEEVVAAVRGPGGGTGTEGTNAARRG